MRQAILAGALMLGLGAAPAFAADEIFVMKAAQGGLAEVELGKLASEKGASDAVKQFGKQMVDDHGKAGDELKTLAQSKKIALSAEISSQDRSLRDRLMKLSGHAFDEAYMKAMLSDHLKDLGEFRTEARSGKDPEVKAWAAKIVPTLEEHLKMARDTNGAVGTAGQK
jgi:putative membrane protein